MSEARIKQIPEGQQVISPKQEKAVASEDVSIDNITIETMKKIFNGKVCSWNPKTRKIKLEYDFSDKKQLNDWIASHKELWNGSILLRKENPNMIFNAPIDLTNLSFDLLPSTSQPRWFFNFPDFNICGHSVRPMYGIMRCTNHDGGSCIYGKVGKTPTKTRHKTDKKYSMKLFISVKDIVWQKNGKVFLKHKYDKGGDVCALGGAKGNAVYDDVVLEGTLNEKWLEKALEGLKEGAALHKAVKDGKCRIFPDAKYFRGHAYKHFSSKKTWVETKGFCEKLGGHLVTISDKWENEFAHSLAVVDGKVERIGLQRTGPRSADFIWCTGEKMKYTNWKKGQPNYYKRIEKTVVYAKGETRWNDYHTGELPFICEWEAPKKDRYKLIVTIKTSDIKNAKSNSWLYVLINSEKSLKYGLDNYDKDDIERGQTDVFEFPVEYPLDKIKNIKLMIDGTDAWACDSISFQFVQRGMKSKIYEFKMKKGQLFSSEKGDKGIKEKIFKLPKVFLQND